MAAKQPKKNPAGPDQEIKTILETARNTERDGKKFYEEAAAKTSNPLAAKMFESLAEAEEKHIEIIDALAAGRLRITAYSGEFAEALRNVFEDMPESVKARAASTPDDIEALKVGVEMEDKSLAFYRKWAKSAVSQEARKLCERLAAEEEDHWKILSGTIEYLEDSGNWFMAQEHWSFDGG
ncbi:MAG TPA: ferritin family protein [Planctomycetota bacterium]|nr:ferritin family protein [Planctomycetota bacterium]